MMSHLLFDKSFKSFPLHTDTQRYTHSFWQYASFPSLQTEITLTHEPLHVYLKSPTRLGGIILVNSLFSYYSERVTSAKKYTFWLQHYMKQTVVYKMQSFHATFHFGRGRATVDCEQLPNRQWNSINVV